METLIELYYMYRLAKQVWQVQNDLRGGYGWIMNTFKRKDSHIYDDSEFVTVSNDAISGNESCKKTNDGLSEVSL